LTLTNRTAATSTALAAQVQRTYAKCTAEASPNPSGPFDLVINATSLGMKETDALPLPLDLLRPETTVADVVATVAQTALLKEAEARGCRTQTGPAMLQAQFEATLGFLDLLPAAAFGCQPESSHTAPRSADHLPARPANPPNHA
jgi:shikimate dehydrogenase